MFSTRRFLSLFFALLVVASCSSNSAEKAIAACPSIMIAQQGNTLRHEHATVILRGVTPESCSSTDGNITLNFTVRTEVRIKTAFTEATPLAMRLIAASTDGVEQVLSNTLLRLQTTVPANQRTYNALTPLSVQFPLFENGKALEKIYLAFPQS